MAVDARGHAAGGNALFFIAADPVKHGSASAQRSAQTAPRPGETPGHVGRGSTGRSQHQHSQRQHSQRQRHDRVPAEVLPLQQRRPDLCC
mmetsp:Transcript_36422/g.107522  ORF Transcript_36422/g.107522 Transcript_36422/m.107522 type:complete len:90 (+) Transcript_36422:77-346(+)